MKHTKFPGVELMKKGLSQESLKLLACITMLIDHVGYALVYPIYQQMRIINGNTIVAARILNTAYLFLRGIGRLSFPIFAFLLVEGFLHTRSRKKYAFRLAIGAVLSEIPYNLVVSGSPVWRYQQSIMITLLLGFCALLAMEHCRKLAWKPVAMIPFAILAELFCADYGWGGVALIALYELSRHMYNRNLIRFCGMLVLFHYMPSAMLRFGNFSLPMQALGALSMLFIVAYDGRKVTGSKAIQWSFYLFYPLHLLVLYFIGMLSGTFQIGISYLT